jgi:hypothetical protein
VISLSGCVAKFRMGGVEKKASMRAFQCMKEHWISLNGSKVMIV